MIGQMIGITTSIATTAAIGVARCGAAAVTGTGHRVPVRTRRIVVRQNADEAIAILKRALQEERDLRGQLERENARLQEMVDTAQELLTELTRPDA